jgi:hypothetical protein
MWLRLSRVCRFIYQPEITALYRIHGGSAMHQRKIQIIETNMRLLSKQLGVSEEGDNIIHQHIADYAEQLYLLGSPESTHWLTERRRLRPDGRGLALLWLSRLGVPAAPVAQEPDRQSAQFHHLSSPPPYANSSGHSFSPGTDVAQHS